MIIVSVAKKEDTPYEELFHVMKEAFKERAEQGLNFVCLSWSLDDFISKLRNNTILIARDTENNDKIIGFERLVFNDDYLDVGITAILPEYKRKGVGSLLYKTGEQIVKSCNYNYIAADTAVGAKSAVKWHIKNGFRKYELRSFKSTNYYSIIFRKQLVPDHKWRFRVHCKLHYWKSAIKCRMYTLANGQPRKSKWLDLYLWLRGAK